MDSKTKQSKGGLERAKKLSPERRSEIARDAALVKSGGFKALHKGNFKEVIGVDIPLLRPKRLKPYGRYEPKRNR